MRFSYDDAFGGPEHELDAYERLIHDVLVGDRTLFTTLRRDRAPLGGLGPVLEDPPAGASATSRVVGAGGDRGADRAAPLAPTRDAVREPSKKSVTRRSYAGAASRIAPVWPASGRFQCSTGRLPAVAVVLDVEVVLLVAAAETSSRGS